MSQQVLSPTRQSESIMLTRYNIAVTASLIMIVVAFAAFKSYQPSDSLDFKSIQEIRVKIENSMYVVTLHDKTTPVLVVSESPMTQDEALDYHMRRILLPNKGKVVVIQVQTDHEARHVDWRSWGSVSATGDPTLLRRLDDLLR